MINLLYTNVSYYNFPQFKRNINIYVEKYSKLFL